LVASLTLRLLWQQCCASDRPHARTIIGVQLSLRLRQLPLEHRNTLRLRAGIRGHHVLGVDGLSLHRLGQCRERLGCDVGLNRLTVRVHLVAALRPGTQTVAAQCVLFAERVARTSI
jgi:hypothetical protein